MNVNSVRLFRRPTGSRITFQLPSPMLLSVAVVYCNEHMKGWELVNGTESEWDMVGSF